MKENGSVAFYVFAEKNIIGNTCVSIFADFGLVFCSAGQCGSENIIAFGSVDGKFHGKGNIRIECDRQEKPCQYYQNYDAAACF
jgi:hypothetical protein